ncbi:MAG: GatB/YqeY domain-containing protein [Candidatus Obscuribacterales bacterium]|nr:GatB/YqeY domain-containing protein [Steroidobacteraceae bacterium]
MAGSLRRQLNGDLLLAMKAKDTVAISALRSVLSALDNASAVPISTVSAPVFGLSGDVPRKDLSETDCQQIISTEVSARSDAVEEYTRLGRGDEAARLCAERAVIERYVRTSEHTQQSVAADRGEDAAPAER